MENAQLITLSRQIALKRQMSVVANNVANVNTTGFKAQSMLYEEFVMPVASAGNQPGNQSLSYTQDWATINDFTPGAISRTGNQLDIALQGDGFLTIQTPGGERWSRAGALQLDASGVLVNASGYPVLSQGGPIRFGSGETDIRFNEDGSITSSAGAKGTLRIVEFANIAELSPQGNSLFSGGEPLPSPSTMVVQGAVERSNVSGVTEIAQMIRVNRSYQSMAKLMQRQDELRRSAIEALGNLAG